MSEDTIRKWRDDDFEGALPTMLSLIMCKYTQVKIFRDVVDLMFRHWVVPVERTTDTFWAAGTWGQQEAIRRNWADLPGRNHMGRLIMLLLTEAWGVQYLADIVWNNGNWGVHYVPEFTNKWWEEKRAEESKPEQHTKQ